MSTSEPQRTEPEVFAAACNRIARRRAELADTPLALGASTVLKAAGAALERSPAGEISLPPIESLPTAPEPETSCPDCGGRGWRVTMGPDFGAGVAERCPCQTPDFSGPEDIPVEYMVAHGCPADLAGCLRSTWDEKRGKWPREADRWPGGYEADDGSHPRSLLIFGDVGNGKSRVAAWIMRRALARGVRCWWLSVPLAIDDANRAISDANAMLTFRTQMAARLSRDMVILDDVAAHRDTDWQVIDLYAAWVRTLHEKSAWVVATTNLSQAQLRAIHPPSASRLMAGLVIHMKGADSRRRTWKERT